MIVQWCIKGLNLGEDAIAKQIIDCKGGLICNWWRTVHKISPPERRDKLTPRNLDLHVNHFTTPDPATGGSPFSKNSPFISLSCGTIERDAAAQTNLVHRALRTALWFGTEFGQHDVAYLYTCWVVLSPRPSVEVETVAEEIRDLNAYRRYSPFQTEGEITAKIIVPDNHILNCEKWEWDRSRLRFERKWTYANRRFTPPERLSNIRELI
jgi:hypothetical protein